MLITVISHSSLDFLIKDKWPSCKNPIVGTSPIVSCYFVMKRKIAHLAFNLKTSINKNTPQMGIFSLLLPYIILKHSFITNASSAYLLKILV